MERKIVNFRMTEIEKRALEEKARKAGMSMSAYLRYLSRVEIETRVKNGKWKMD